MLFKKSLLILFLVLVLITGCGDSGEIDAGVSEADQALTRAAEIANQGMTQTASAISLAPTATVGPPSPTVTLIYPTTVAAPNNAVTATLDNSGTGGSQTPAATQGGGQTPAVTQAATPTSTPFSTPTAAASGSTPCYRANFEYETIPDGTRIAREKDFVKIWRLKNTGTCTWTAGFDIIFVEGDILNASSAVALTSIDIRPGEYVDATVNMQSPLQTGRYRGYWMLRSNDGVIFGVSITATAWLWVDIISFDPAALP